MSSSSFGSSNYCEGYPRSSEPEGNYDRVNRHQPYVPYYDNLGQPLVYYAEVQPYCARTQRGRPRKANRNCFVRAFEWYTQERCVDKPRERMSPEVSGFAAWLDTKYGEYLQDTDVNPTICPLQQQCNSAMEQMICQPCISDDQPATRRFPRTRSPWNKRKPNLNKPAGDQPCKKSNVSCEFILQPKDVTRPASECCYHTPISCPNKSNTTVISTEAGGVKKTIVKSQSLTNVCGRVTPNYVDTITVQEGTTRAPCSQNVVKDVQLTIERPRRHSDGPCVAKQEIPCAINEEIPCSTKEEPCVIKQETPCAVKREVPCVDQQDSCNAKPQKVPLRLVLTENTCDQSCTTKDECEKRAVIHAPQPPVPICDENCTVKPDYKSTPVKSQRSYVLSSQAHTFKRECGIIKEQQLAAISHRTVSLCDENCTTKQECSILAKQVPKISKGIQTSSDLSVSLKENSKDKANKKRSTPIFRTVDHECQCPEEIDTPVDDECQCPEESVTPVVTQAQSVRQTVASTNTSDVSCHCFKLEKPLTPVKQSERITQPTPKVISQPRLTKALRKTSKAEVACQCPEDEIIKFDAPCQYDRNDFKTNSDILCVCPKIEKQSSVYTLQRTGSFSARNLLKKMARPPPTFNSDGVQTSDHSIKLENAGGHDYAYFMKIICADKLNDCVCNNTV